MSARILAPLVCITALVLGCQAQNGASPAASNVAPSEESPIAARIGDETITLAELDAYIKDGLFAQQTGDGNPSKLFDVRRPALDELVFKRVLADLAASRNVTIDELVAAEAEALGEVTDDEVLAFYGDKIDEMGGRSLEDLTPRIREYLSQVRAQEAANALVSAAGVEILLDRPRVEVATDGPSKGPADATVTLVEFSDFQCPFCTRSLAVIEELLKRYPEDLRVVYRHLPLDNIHSYARAAAEASACAEDQNQFWPYHDLLFANSKTLADEDLKRFAAELELDMAAFESCYSEGRFKQKVEDDLQAAHAIGITGTPAFVVNGVIISGAKPVEAFLPVIDEEIARAEGSESS
ncbi:MAG: DsbA family protein [Myxococcota bacterium]